MLKHLIFLHGLCVDKSCIKVTTNVLSTFSPLQKQHPVLLLLLFLNFRAVDLHMCRCREKNPKKIKVSCIHSMDE